MASQPPTNPFTIPDPSTLLSDVTDAIPGASFILDVVKAVTPLPALVEKLVNDAVIQHPLDTLTKLFGFAEKAGHIFELGQIDFWTWMSKIGVGPIFAEFLELGMGVKVGEFSGEEVDAMTTVDTMLAFAVTLPIASAALNAAGEALFAGRWPKSLHEAIKDLPEEMGLTWPLGMTIEETFKAAQGRILEEAINKQKRPNRIAWQQMRVLLKQHVVTDTQLTELFKAQGFPDEQIDWLKKLADVTIPVGDISQLYYREKIDETEAKKLIGELGFNDRDTQHILELYVTKAETQASVTYRSIAKQMYVNHLLSETQYRAILTESNFPSRMIDADIAGISLEQTVGHVLETVALVKTEYLHKRIDPAEATRRLALLNYAPSYITDLINSWDLPAIKAKHGLSTAKVLSYMISGLLTPGQARPMLQANGVDDTTVEFLLAHPTANTGAKQHVLSPGLVTQAYMDGAILLPDLSAAYTKSGVPDSSLSYYLNIAKYKFSHKRGNAGYTQTLGTGDYKSAYKYGLIDFPGLITSLESIGWRPDDALLLAEIENKGPYQPAQPPAFATLSAALAYLQQAGFTLHTPTDPRLLAAENMAAVAGYTWSPPPTPVGGSEVLPPVTDPGPGTQTGGFTLP